MFQRTCQSKSRSRFFPVIITLPRKHSSLETVCHCFLAGSHQTVNTIIDHRFGNSLIQQQHRGKHPKFRIPEYMSIVTLWRKSHGRDAQSASFPARRIKVEKCKPNRPLCFVIPFYQDIAFPQFIPKTTMCNHQRSCTFMNSINHLPFSFIIRIAKVTGGAYRTHQSKRYLLSFLQIQHERHLFNHFIIKRLLYCSLIKNKSRRSGNFLLPMSRYSIRLQHIHLCIIRPHFPEALCRLTVFLGNIHPGSNFQGYIGQSFHVHPDKPRIRHIS